MIRVIPVCNRCGQRRAAVMVRKCDKRLGYCRKCLSYLRGEISEDEAPRIKLPRLVEAAWKTRQQQGY
jgi:hypothetical protein